MSEFVDAAARVPVTVYVLIFIVALATAAGYLLVRADERAHEVRRGATAPAVRGERRCDLPSGGRSPHSRRSPLAAYHRRLRRRTFAEWIARVLTGGTARFR